MGFAEADYAHGSLAIQRSGENSTSGTVLSNAISYRMNEAIFCHMCLAKTANQLENLLPTL
jgi:hypothetical protein